MNDKCDRLLLSRPEGASTLNVFVPTIKHEAALMAELAIMLTNQAVTHGSRKCYALEHLYLEFADQLRCAAVALDSYKSS